MTNNYISQDSDERKRTPMAAGLLDYFPAALAAVAEHSFISNEKHNPGQPLHWSRGNSTDHADCVARHLVERGGYEYVTYNGREYKVRHSAALAWRALALLQEELEAEGATPGRASRFPENVYVGVDLGAPGGDHSALAVWHKDKMYLHGSQWAEDDLAKARGHKHAQPLSFNKMPSYDVKVVAEKEADRETAKVLEGLLNYWRKEGEGEYELTPKADALLDAARRGAAAGAAMKARKKKRAVPKPARKRK